MDRTWSFWVAWVSADEEIKRNYPYANKGRGTNDVFDILTIKKVSRPHEVTENDDEVFFFSFSLNSFD